MNEELDYAEMLEIPVETVTINRREHKKRRRGAEDLGEQLVEQVNDRMQSDTAEEEPAQEADDPAFAESKPIEREAKPAKRKRAGIGRKILIGELVAVCALCAVIFFTNIFMTNSAINTFVRGLFQGSAETADKRTYSDFKLSSVVNETTEAELTVSETGVLSFTAKCSVYSPAIGTVAAVNGSAEEGYTVSVRHSDSFSTVIGGLDTVYLAAGDSVYGNIPLGYSDGEGAVTVMMYSGDQLLNCYSVGENGLSWS